VKETQILQKETKGTKKGKIMWGKIMGREHLQTLGGG
jgi:hypothetical protein